MARPLRIEFPGALYHVSARGNARQDIFLDDQDRQRFLGVLERVVSRFHLLLHAYCLMDNHFHLVVETPEANLSQAMRQLNGVYTQAFNRRHDLVGHVLQGRFRAIVVDRDSYLLELCRYVVLNPDSRVARLTRARSSLSEEDVTGYARLAEHLFGMPVVYVEYSGCYGDPRLVRAARAGMARSRLFYGGGIATPDQAREMARLADTVVVGNLIYYNVDAAVQTVRHVKETPKP